MKRLDGTTVKKICIAVGACLLAGALAVLVVWQVGIQTSKKRAQEYVRLLYEILPTPQTAVLEERSDTAMAVASVDGTDFVGLLEFPRFESVLPIGAAWGKSSRYPCRFGGSIYDGTLQIGATSQQGQYDFYRDISVGDSVYLTDAEGSRYTLTVTGLRYETHIDQAALCREEAVLTVFIKNVYALEYLVVYCRG